MMKPLRPIGAPPVDGYVFFGRKMSYMSASAAALYLSLQMLDRAYPYQNPLVRLYIMRAIDR